LAAEHRPFDTDGLPFLDGAHERVGGEHGQIREFADLDRALVMLFEARIGAGGLAV
jgi:hypothetical protein